VIVTEESPPMSNEIVSGPGQKTSIGYQLALLSLVPVAFVSVAMGFMDRLITIWFTPRLN
jgi:hypothetical protein